MSSPLSFGPRVMVINSDPHPNDVLFGRRGGICNNHPGRKKYISWIRGHQRLYYRTINHSMKKGICQSVVNAVRNQDPPGRFLLWNNECTGWMVVVDEEMILAKVGQAFRDAHKAAREPSPSHENNYYSTVTRRDQFNTQPTTRVDDASLGGIYAIDNNVMRNQINIPPFLEGRDIDTPTTTTKCDVDNDDLLGPAISRLYPNTTAVTTTTASRQSSTEKMMTPSSDSSPKFALETTFWKEFPDYGWFQGTVTRYNQFTGLYLVSYPDGDSEELDKYQIQDLLRNNPPDPNNNNNNNNDSSNSNHKRSTPTVASLQEGDIITKEVIGPNEQEEEEKEEPTTSEEGLDAINNNNGSGRSIDEPVLLLSDNEDDDDDNETGHKDTPAAAGEASVAATSNQDSGITTTRSSDEPSQQVPAAQTTTCTNNNNSGQQGASDSSTATTRSSPDEPQPEQTESNNDGNQQLNGAIRSDATSAEGKSQQQAQASSGDNNTNNEVGSVSSVASTRASDEPPQKKRQRLDHQGNHHQPARMKAEGGIRPQHSKSQQQQQQSGGSKYAHLLFSHEKSDVTITCQDDQSSTPVVAPSSPSATRPYCGGISVQMPAHKKVLAKSSPVLKALWLADPTSNTLSFPSYPAPVVKQVLIHIYTSQTVDPTILRSYLPQFLEFTKLYGFEDLHMCVGRQAYNLLNLNNLEKILKASLSVSDGASSMMKDVCFAYIQNHAEEVLTSPRMTRLTTEDPGLWRNIVQAALAPKREFALLCQKNNEVA